MRAQQLAGPVIIICLGVLFLLNNFGLHLPFGVLVRNVWPFLLIAIGAAHLAAHSRPDYGGRPGSLTGSLVLITLGALFALQHHAGLSFRSTWPVLLIVTGVAGILQFRSGDARFGAHWNGGGARR